MTPADDHVPDRGLAAATRLVGLATRSDDPGALLEAAAGELRRAFGLAGPGAEPLASAPADELGTRAARVACAAASGTGRPPARWRVLAVAGGDGRQAHLAVGPPPECDDGCAAVVSLLPALLTTQLQRAGLRAIALAARRATFVRRLIRDPQLDDAAAEREAAEVGVALAGAYHAAVLAWPGGAPRPETAQDVQAEATRLAPRSLSVPVDGVLVLLHPDGPGSARHASGWLERIARFARSNGCGQAAQALAGGAAHRPAELRDAVDDLLVLSRLLGAPGEHSLVVPVERFGLEHLLARGLERRAASAFVNAQLGRLIRWDAQHGDNLLDVLEAALDLQRHDQAAERCFMHRNTFRQRLRHALQLAGGSLEEPERRLALHVAIKLRRVLAHEPGPPRPLARGRGHRASDVAAERSAPARSRGPAATVLSP